MIRKPPFWATICTIMGIAMLCGLGTWQVQRLHWKEGLLRNLDSEYAKDAAGISLSAADFNDSFEFRRGTISGVYAFSKQIMIGPRFYESLPGHHVLTPLQLDDGSFVLVNRGWVPQSWDVHVDEDTGETVSLTGLLRRPSPGNPFTGENNPDKDEWYRIDMDQIAAAKKLKKIRPYVFYPENISGTVTDYPVPQPAKPELSNSHLQYAVFWFSMAGILLVMFVLRFLRPGASG